MNNNPNTSNNLYHIDIQLSDKCKVCGHKGVHADAMINSPATSTKLYHIHCSYCNSQYYSSDISASHTTDSSSHLLGWECPKCHSVMSPFQPYCMKCAGQMPSTNFNSGDLT